MQCADTNPTQSEIKTALKHYIPCSKRKEKKALLRKE
jgi:hypothetical protein